MDGANGTTDYPRGTFNRTNVELKLICSGVSSGKALILLIVPMWN